MALSDIVARYLSGERSAEITVMHLLLATEDLDVVREVARDVPALSAVVAANEAGCARIVRMLQHGDDSSEPALSVDAGIAAARRLFDRSVADSEESSVALYSLGNPQILEAATREVVDELDRYGVLRPDATVVELGCGIGRFLVALAPRVGRIWGLDLSPAMVAVARRRCAAFPQVQVDIASGRDLVPVADGAADLVLAVDVFPYVVQAGPALVEALFQEIDRVLAPDGELALFQFSYRGDLQQDRDDVQALAARHGLVVRISGELRFTLWDGPVFRLARAPSGGSPRITPARWGR